MNNINRRSFLRFAGVAGLSTVLPVTARTESTKDKPNILFIAVDDLRPQLGCYGHEQIVSPNIDKLAAQGTVFNRAYCQVPVCGASRASLLTGIRPTPKRFLNYNTWAQKDAPGITDLPGWFKQHGYETFTMGKVYHHQSDNQASWTKIGDDSIKRKAFGDYHLPQKKSAKGRGLPYECADEPENTYFQYQLADAAISRLQKIKKSGKPGFLAVGFTKPHLPFVAPKKYWDLYKREDIKLAPNPFAPEGAPKQAMHNFGELRQYYDVPQKGPIPDDMALTLKHGYFACVSYTDAMIGRVLDELDRLGMRENTIIVLWGDHGWQLGEHGLWCKHCNFNTSLNAPLIVSAPGQKKGQKLDSLVEFVDIYPTLCELSGLPRPEHLQGTSFVPLLADGSRQWKDAVFSRWFAGDSVRTDRYLYTHWTKNGKVEARMLYDHQTDPMENTNIAEQPDMADVVKAMEKRLADGWKPIAAAIK